jgi:hypothetical protein
MCLVAAGKDKRAKTLSDHNISINGQSAIDVAATIDAWGSAGAVGDPDAISAHVGIWTLGTGSIATIGLGGKIGAGLKQYAAATAFFALKSEVSVHSGVGKKEVTDKKTSNGDNTIVVDRHCLSLDLGNRASNLLTVTLPQEKKEDGIWNRYQFDQTAKKLLPRYSHRRSRNKSLLLPLEDRSTVKLLPNAKSFSRFIIFVTY